MSNPILGKKEVRQAISYAINKQEIIKNVYQDKYQVANFPLDYGSYLKSDWENNTYQPEKAKKVLKDGGIGFDYRMAMNIPDYWIKLIKEAPDENWKPSSMFWEVTNRRKDEKTISYCESHDQKEEFRRWLHCCSPSSGPGASRLWRLF